MVRRGGFLELLVPKHCPHDPGPAPRTTISNDVRGGRELKSAKMKRRHVRGPKRIEQTFLYRTLVMVVRELMGAMGPAASSGSSSFAWPTSTTEAAEEAPRALD